MTFEMGAWPVLGIHTITTVTGGAQGEIIPLPAPCNLAHGAEGAMPAGGGNFGTAPQVGDRVFLDADGSDYAVPLTSASAWWLGFHWTTPYLGAGSQNGACSVLRGEAGTANGSFDPQGPLTVPTGRTQTIRFFPHAGHVIEADFTPGTLTYHLTVQGQNGPGAYLGTGDHPGVTWVGIGATPGSGFKFDHWIITFGHATVENPLANPTRVFLNSSAVVLAVYTQSQDPYGGIPAYQDGSSYNTGVEVVNVGNRYACLVGGWCSIGGPYAPGTGWAWENAWQVVGSCN